MWLFLLALLPSGVAFADENASTTIRSSSMYNIPLAPNVWNLISIPVDVPDESIPAVLGTALSSVDTIYRYAPEISNANGGWAVYQAKHPELSSLTILQPGFGYFVKTNASTSVNVNGTLFTGTQIPPSRKLGSGWNLVGVFGGTADHSEDIDTVFSSIGFSGVDYLALWKMDPLTQSFTTTDTASPGDAFWMLLDAPHSYGPSTF